MYHTPIGKHVILALSLSFSKKTMITQGILHYHGHQLLDMILDRANRTAE